MDSYDCSLKSEKHSNLSDFLLFSCHKAAGLELVGNRITVFTSGPFKYYIGTFGGLKSDQGWILILDA